MDQKLLAMLVDCLSFEIDLFELLGSLKSRSNVFLDQFFGFFDFLKSHFGFVLPVLVNLFHLLIYEWIQIWVFWRFLNGFFESIKKFEKCFFGKILIWSYNDQELVLLMVISKLNLMMYKDIGALFSTIFDQLVFDQSVDLTLSVLDFENFVRTYSHICIKDLWGNHYWNY